MENELLITSQKIWDTIQEHVSDCIKPLVILTPHHTVQLSWSNSTQYIELEFNSNGPLQWYFSNSLTDQNIGEEINTQDLPEEFYKQLSQVLDFIN
jgi:hypothetical protein